MTKLSERQTALLAELKASYEAGLAESDGLDELDVWEIAGPVLDRQPGLTAAESDAVLHLLGSWLRCCGSMLLAEAALLRAGAKEGAA